MKYRKKPVEVEAWEITKKNLRHLVALCGGSIAVDGRKLHGLIIPTLEGNMTGLIGDYLIRGVAGEYYSCKPDIFAATYELSQQEESDDG